MRKRSRIVGVEPIESNRSEFLLLSGFFNVESAVVQEEQLK